MESIYQSDPLKRQKSRETLKKSKNHDTLEEQVDQLDYIELETGRQTPNEAYFDDTSQTKDNDEAKAQDNLTRKQSAKRSSENDSNFELNTTVEPGHPQSKRSVELTSDSQRPGSNPNKSELKDLKITMMKIMRDNQKTSRNLKSLVDFIKHSDKPVKTKSSKIEKRRDKLSSRISNKFSSFSPTRIQMMPSFKMLMRVQNPLSYLKFPGPNQSQHNRFTAQSRGSVQNVQSMRGLSHSYGGSPKRYSNHTVFSKNFVLPKSRENPFVKKNSLFVRNAKPLSDKVSLSEINIFNTPEIDNIPDKKNENKQISAFPRPEEIFEEPTQSSKSPRKSSKSNIRTSQSQTDLRKINQFILDNDTQEENLMESEEDSPPRSSIERDIQLKQKPVNEVTQDWSFSKNEVSPPEKSVRADSHKNLVRLSGKLEENSMLKKEVERLRELVDVKEKEITRENERIGTLELKVNKLETQIESLTKRQRQEERLNRSHLCRISEIELENLRLSKENTHLKKMNKLYRELSLEKQVHWPQFKENSPEYVNRFRKKESIFEFQEVPFSEMKPHLMRSQPFRIDSDESNWRDVLNDKLANIKRIHQKRSRLQNLRRLGATRQFSTGRLVRQRNSLHSKFESVKRDPSSESYNIYRQERGTHKDSFFDLYRIKKQISESDDLSGRGSKAEIDQILAIQNGLNQRRKKKNVAQRKLTLGNVLPWKPKPALQAKNTKHIQHKSLNQPKTIANRFQVKKRGTAAGNGADIKQRIRKKLFVGRRTKKRQSKTKIVSPFFRERDTTPSYQIVKKTEDDLTSNTSKKNRLFMTRVDSGNLKLAESKISKKPTKESIESMISVLREYKLNPDHYKNCSPKSILNSQNFNAFQSGSKQSQLTSSKQKIVHTSMLDGSINFLRTSSQLKTLKSMGSNLQKNSETDFGISNDLKKFLKKNNLSRAMSKKSSDLFRTGGFQKKSSLVRSRKKLQSNSVSLNYTESNSEPMSPMNFQRGIKGLSGESVSNELQSMYSSMKGAQKKRIGDKGKIYFKTMHNEYCLSPKYVKADSEILTNDDIILSINQSLQKSSTEKFIQKKH